MLVHVCMLSCFSHIWLFATLWTAAHRASLSMGFSRQEYWSGLPCLPPGDLPDPGVKPVSLASTAFAGGFFTTSATWEAPWSGYFCLIFCTLLVDKKLDKIRNWEPLKRTFVKAIYQIKITKTQRWGKEDKIDSHIKMLLPTAISAGLSKYLMYVLQCVNT